MRRQFYFLLLLLCIGSAPNVFANHLLGAEITYKHIATNGLKQTYQVRLAFFADCSSDTGPGSVFNALINAYPVVKLYKGDQYMGGQNMTYVPAESNIEITPVCPDEAPNTTCVDIFNPIPGIKKFIYVKDFELEGFDLNWRFCFEGSITNNSMAGRSSIIQNAIVNDGSAAGIVMFLEATLNNTLAPNSSTTFTSMPTPFFCLNKASTYSLGAADPENDVLQFSLINAKQMTATNVPPALDVTYIPPFTPTLPLPTAPGNFNFNAANGQMSFTPNQVMNCLVVNMVEEYRDGIKVGSSMREMTFVILDNCNNDAAITDVHNIQNAHTVTDPNGNLILSVCEGQLDDLSFDIDMSDPNNDNTNVTFSNLPIGASLDIQDNGTVSPKIKFRWNVIDAPPGNYIFYITYTDDGCPLVSTKTIAYTIQIIPHINEFIGGEIPTCEGMAKGAAWVVPKEAVNLMYNYRWVNSLGEELGNTNSTTGDTLRNLAAETYKVYIRNAEGCGTNVMVTVSEQPAPVVEVRSDTTLCTGMPIYLEPLSMQTDVDYKWSTGAEECCITVVDSGWYILTAYNTCGSAEDSVYIRNVYCDFCLFIPNAFTPNGDGQNDYFLIRETCLLDKFKLNVFNRWGQLIFSSFTTSQSWDGTHNGRQVDAGTYFYYVEATPLDKSRGALKLKGDITLLR
jgi:gliding motility-associated-like protein